MYQFIDRHNGPRKEETDEMLRVAGAETMNELIEKIIPSNIRLNKTLKLDAPLSENACLEKIKAIASKNRIYRSFIGTGFYRTATPAVILRNIFENPGWYTSYTPYQSEISQGRLEALINFQTMIISLTAMEIANCSLLDESTAAAEAMRMMYELRLRTKAATKEDKNTVFVDENIFPQTKEVILTRATPLGIKVETGKFDEYEFHSKVFGAIVQYPGANGKICDYKEFCTAMHEKEILVTVAADILSLALLVPPGEWGADIVVGSAQRFGLPLGFGGPSAGYMATKNAFKRYMPGRIIGVSTDRHGKTALRMALQTREQHIKREKATSNICTAQALLAVMAGMYAIYHGPEGIRQIAVNAHKYAYMTAHRLKQAGYKLTAENYFDTIEIEVSTTDPVKKAALEKQINFFYPDSQHVRISFDELTAYRDVQDILSVFGIDGENRLCHEIESAGFDPVFSRKSLFLTQPVFGRYRSETELMRYIKKLERRDISLTHSMISLGSCTMKLNAAAEMLPLSWPEMCDIHPFVPADQAEGYHELIDDLAKDLAEITGFSGISFQPNSGAGGEYAGLLVIRQYHISRGESYRNIVLIPSSAHGTNPASAAMAGMETVTVGCDENGNISLSDLKEKAEAYKDRLSCVMITYPSTHGVFESAIREIIDTVHKNGGQAYMDGANMNAQTGLTSPGFIGADVCHLNLHKTFAIPHGGGGPGEGPVCVAKHLVPFLPSHPAVKVGGTGTAVSASPYGSALILAITYGYIKMLGAEGLRKATEIAILNANYLSKKLYPAYKTLYTGETGYVAHECIIDLRDFSKIYGVDATDIAKRLMDFGFHAPTLSFPVVNTLMIEPTESESKQELDRFVEAMLTIKQECEDIKSGKSDKNDNPLKMAPHTMLEVAADNWTHPYSRRQAAFALPWIADNKFWPASARVNNGYGDRNLVCVCDPVWQENTLPLI
ncbi:MAG: aminomethyl-transferring glycine dehydrogenase [Prevotellaceae bacterium]|jgi:glycine dehydrogenase|nr:aminomethyl-transferring glycine dehydrogenase [Prevotellaceae bacterium]